MKEFLFLGPSAWWDIFIGIACGKAYRDWERSLRSCFQLQAPRQDSKPLFRPLGRAGLSQEAWMK